jgi:hypothetical protein
MENNTEHKLVTSDYKSPSKKEIDGLLLQITFIKFLAITTLLLVILQNLLQGR